MSMKNQEELLVRYLSPYKVVDGNLCMEVTEKHGKYDKKLANFTPYIKSERKSKYGFSLDTAKNCIITGNFIVEYENKS